jgi:hypothetical protein
MVSRAYGIDACGHDQPITVGWCSTSLLCGLYVNPINVTIFGEHLEIL